MKEVDPQGNDPLFERFCLEEYKALRAESLRCAGLTSNAIWVGITQFAVTVGAAAALARDNASFRFLVLGLLCLESMAASIMFLSELWKYARVGRYIREKIERPLCSGQNDVLKSPLFWETWITERRASPFYVVSLMMLQLPIVTTGLFLVVSAFPFLRTVFPGLEAFRLLGEPNVAWGLLLGVLILIDLLVIFYMGLNVRAESKAGLRDGDRNGFPGFAWLLNFHRPGKAGPKDRSLHPRN